MIGAVGRLMGRISGQRAIIEFSPKLVSLERLCAGVVIRLNDGEVLTRCSLDKRKMEHAFGNAGMALYEIALALCSSLAQHWTSTGSVDEWVPPFEGANLARVSPFSAKNAESALGQGIELHSSLGTLLASYEITESVRSQGIVEKVKTVVRRDVNTKHLEKRFNRTIPLGDQTLPLKVDFLGQNFACYFVQLPTSARSSEQNTERACGKLLELQVLRRMMKKPKKALGLLDEERPNIFELLMVGAKNDPVQRAASYKIEAMADKGEVRVLMLSSPVDAAEHVSNKERLAA
ncbi:MAG: hypothetical protein ABI410_18840 [Rhodoferax sp.]|uniref:hypothetical protein n=1 Tax=Rhodoferax sp. TaxID=50421 RepID=UPI0032671BCD